MLQEERGIMLKTVFGVALAALVLILGAFLSINSATQASPRWAVTPLPPTPTPIPATPTAVALVGDPARGQEIFAHGVNGSPPCTSCHATTSSRSVFQLGPNLARLGERAGARVPGLSAEEYIHQSILDPTAFFVSGYRPIMPLNFADHFNEQDVADLIAYLLTL